MITIRRRITVHRTARRIKKQWVEYSQAEGPARFRLLAGLIEALCGGETPPAELLEAISSGLAEFFGTLLDVADGTVSPEPEDDSFPVAALNVLRSKVGETI
jgi:hypothetical protein